MNRFRIYNMDNYIMKSRKPSLKKYTTESFIEKAKSIHGDIYDYSKAEYTGIKNKFGGHTECFVIDSERDEFKLDDVLEYMIQNNINIINQETYK